MPSVSAGLPEVVLGVYEIVRPLGQGGMGEVFLGRHRTTNEPVVIKRMHAHLAADVKIRQSFLSEAHILRRFRHPCAVELLDAEVREGAVPSIVLAYVPGTSVQARLQQETRFTPLRAGRLLGQLCAALQALHERGFRHGDLSPANLMVEQIGGHEALTLIDFGLAHDSGLRLSLERLQGHESIGGGTPDFLSPEQVLGEAVDHRGDLYAVGTILYLMLTGHLPFEHLEEAHDIIEAHVQLPILPFAHFGIHDVEPKLEALVQRCLAKSPADRPPSARALAEEYQQILGRPMLDERLFVGSAETEEPPPFDPATVLDRFEAWMPEAVAVMKLRGFVAGMGGVVVECLPGLIKVLLPDASATPPAPRTGFLGWFSRPAPAPVQTVLIELHLAKKENAGRSLVDITVARPHRPDAQTRDAEKDAAFGGLVCRELRAYLMIGR